MAIQDYATLTTSIQNWTARSDLNTVIPDFILLAEARINRELKVRQMLSTVGLTASSGSVTLPTDMLSIVRFSILDSGQDRQLEPLPSSANLNARQGVAIGYVVEGSVAKIVGGSGSEDVTLSYYGKIPALVNGANWLITNYPDVYLYATLLETAPYIGNDPKIAVWQAGYESAIESLNRTDSEARFGASPRVRLDFYAP